MPKLSVCFGCLRVLEYAECRLCVCVCVQGYACASVLWPREHDCVCMHALRGEFCLRGLSALQLHPPRAVCPYCLNQCCGTDPPFLCCTWWPWDSAPCTSVSVSVEKAWCLLWLGAWHVVN